MARAPARLPVGRRALGRAGRSGARPVMRAPVRAPGIDRLAATAIWPSARHQPSHRRVAGRDGGGECIPRSHQSVNVEQRYSDIQDMKTCDRKPCDKTGRLGEAHAIRALSRRGSSRVLGATLGREKRPESASCVFERRKTPRTRSAWRGKICGIQRPSVVNQVLCTVPQICGSWARPSHEPSEFIKKI